MKRIFIPALLTIMLLAAVATPGAMALVSPSAAYYVTDDAGVLSEVTKQDIISANIDLEQQCRGAQIVIVTVEYLDGMSSEKYATQLFNDWQVGSLEGGNNGMLLLLATEEFKGWLVVGAGISGSFTDKMADDYLDKYFWDEVDARNYDTAVRNICEALFSWYAGYYGVNQGGTEPGTNNPSPVPTIGRPIPEPVPTVGRPIPEPEPTGGVTGYYGFGVNFALVAFWCIFIFIIVIIIVAAAGSDRARHRAYYVHMGMPIPHYHWWYAWGGHRPHRIWYNNYRHNHWRGGPRGPGPRGPGPRGPGGYGGPRGPGTPPRGPGGGGRPGGGFGGGSSGGGRSGGGFGGFGGGGFGGGGGGGFGGGGSGGGGGGFSGGGGGRR